MNLDLQGVFTQIENHLQIVLHPGASLLEGSDGSSGGSYPGYRHNGEPSYRHSICMYICIWRHVATIRYPLFEIIGRWAKDVIEIEA